jgi:hypothetical protein
MVLAGTDATAYEYVRLVGDRAASEKVYLTGFYYDVQAGTYVDLLINTQSDLGDIQVVTLGLEAKWDNAWFVQYSKVYKYSDPRAQHVSEAQYPCYHWIGKNKHVTTTSKTGKLHWPSSHLVHLVLHSDSSHSKTSPVEQDPLVRERGADKEAKEAVPVADSS